MIWTSFFSSHYLAVLTQYRPRNSLPCKSVISLFAEQQAFMTEDEDLCVFSGGIPLVLTCLLPDAGLVRRGPDALLPGKVEAPDVAGGAGEVLRAAGGRLVGVVALNEGGLDAPAAVVGAGGRGDGHGRGAGSASLVVDWN